MGKLAVFEVKEAQIDHSTDADEDDRPDELSTTMPAKIAGENRQSGTRDLPAHQDQKKH